MKTLTGEQWEAIKPLVRMEIENLQSCIQTTHLNSNIWSYAQFQNRINSFQKEIELLESVL